VAIEAEGEFRLELPCHRLEDHSLRALAAEATRMVDRRRDLKDARRPGRPADPLGPRIIFACDCHDAMTSDRPLP
jgi:hypothetical protein